MQNLENLDVFEILIAQNLLKCLKDPFVRSGLICILFSICLVTETEIRNGIVNVENPDQHCLWMKRNIDDIEVQEASRELSRYMGEASTAPEKSAYWKIIFFISHPKHMLWVFKRTVSMRRFY